MSLLRKLFLSKGLLLLLSGCLLPAWLPSDAQNGESLRAEAAAARDRGDVPQAITLYKQAVAADPHWADGWWFLGNLEYRLDHFSAARQALNEYIEISPKAVAALALRGLCEYETGAYAESLGDIEQAISLGAAIQPRNAQILLYHEALLLTRLGRFEEAVAKYSAFVKQGLTNQDVAVGFGLAGLRIQQLPQTALPEDVQAAMMAGRAAFLIVQGEIGAGRRAFEEMSTALPSRANIHYFCGYLLLSTDPDQAADELQRELEVDPASAPAHTMLAWTLEMQGDYQRALPMAQAAVQEDAELSTNQLVLGRALLETGDPKGSVGPLDRAVAADSSSLEAHISLAKAYSELGRKDQAREQRLLSLKLSREQEGHATN